jgi:hypothetical protein
MGLGNLIRRDYARHGADSYMLQYIGSAQAPFFVLMGKRSPDRGAQGDNVSPDSRSAEAR